MRTYTAKEKKLLEKNPYTFKVTDHKLLFTAEFKREFWQRYQTGMKPRSIMADLGYDLEMLGQRQIDSIGHSIREQAARGAFYDGNTHNGRRTASVRDEADMTEDNFRLLWNEVQYLRQEMEAMKRLRPAGSASAKVSG